MNTKLKSQYSLKNCGSYLELIISGEYNFEDFLFYTKFVSDECEKENIYKVLVNALALKNANAPTMDRFYFGKYVAESLRPKIKLAALWPVEHIDKFAETVAVNRGSNMLVFENIEEAKEWLLKD